ncbi:MAG: hypothetical protein JOZ96_21945 [Acidobacteria bacterium]|nr:hypothetical protein [Acidobacteriota bacterium]
MTKLAMAFALLFGAAAAAHAQVPGGSPGSDAARAALRRGDAAAVDEAHIASTRDKNKVPDKWYDKPDTFKAEIKVTNNSAKPIKSVTWTATLLNAETGNFIRSFDVTTRKKISPGKTRSLSERFVTPRDLVVRANARHPNRPNVADLKVKVKTVTYADGTTSTTP